MVMVMGMGMGETEEEQVLVLKPNQEEEELGLGLGLGLGLDSSSTPLPLLSSQSATDNHSISPPLISVVDSLQNLGLQNERNEIDDDDDDNEEDDDKNVKFCHHPLRPGESDCLHYVRTGTCRFGLICRFNHPPRTKNQVDWEKEGYQERRWQVDYKNLGLEKKENENSEDQIVDEADRNGRFQHPLRPGEPDCTHYIRTGTCRYGLLCRYNHPPRSKKQVRSSDSPDQDEEKEEETEEYEEGEGQVECKYYLRPGGCKYGAACRFLHIQEKTFSAPTLDLNFLGLPVRPGERECPFYMRNGSCKFATNCRFHHPNPTDPGGMDPVSGYQSTGSMPLNSSSLSPPVMPSWSLPISSNGMVTYMNASPPYASEFLPQQGVNQNLEWNGINGYMPPQNPSYPPSANMGRSLGTFLSGPTTKVDGFTHHQQQMPVDEYPERPGEKECEYFMKNGDCKYKLNCRFHHPKNRATKCVLSPMGLPLRPDAVTCSYYRRFGICKFGPACKYDHPPNSGSSASGGSRMGGHGNAREPLIQQSV